MNGKRPDYVQQIENMRAHPLARWYLFRSRVTSTLISAWQLIGHPCTRSLVILSCISIIALEELLILHSALLQPKASICVIEC